MGIEESHTASLEEQNTVLQANNTKLVLEKREVEKQLAYFKDSASQFSSFVTCPACTMEEGVITSRCWTHECEEELVLRVRELEQDSKRLDWLERQVSVSDVCSHLDWDFNTAYTLRQAIDEARVKGWME